LTPLWQKPYRGALMQVFGANVVPRPSDKTQCDRRSAVSRICKSDLNCSRFNPLMKKTTDQSIAS